MTQIDIAALVADREAGTKGPWVAESGHVQQNGQPYWQVTDGSDAIMQNQFCWCQGDHEANARRIARVPDMEAALIAQDAELKRYRAALEFYADRDFCGYDVHVTDYGLSIDNGRIIKDGGSIARAALGEKP